MSKGIQMVRCTGKSFSRKVTPVYFPISEAVTVLFLESLSTSYNVY